MLDATSQIFVIEPDGTPIAVIDSTVPDLGFAETFSFALDDAGRMYYGDLREGVHGRMVIGQVEAPLWPPD